MDKYYRKRLDENTNNIKFQVLEFYVDKDDVDKDDDDDCKEKEFVMNMFGCTDKGNSICLSVNGFKLSFYVKVPDSWKKTDKEAFIAHLKSNKSVYYFKNELDIKGTKITKKKIFHGFTGDDTSKFIRLSFSSMRAFYGFRKVLSAPYQYNGKSYDFILFEEKVDITLQFIHGNNDFKTVGWYVFDKTKCIFSDNTHCKLEYNTNISNLTAIDTNEVAHFLQASYDIETYSHDVNQFPNADNKEDVIFQIGTCFKIYGNNEFLLKHIITLKDCDQINEKDTIIQCCKTEKDLLLAWKDLIIKMDPDIISSYNGDKFDSAYLSTRANRHNLSSFFYFSKFKSIPVKLEEKMFSSSAYGNSAYKRFNIPGRINYDILISIQRDFRLDSYKLDFVSAKYLKKSIKLGLTKDLNEGSNILPCNEEVIKNSSRGSVISLYDGISKESMGSIISIDKENMTITMEKEITENYSKNNTEIIIDTHKNHVTPIMMFSYYESGTSKQVSTVAEYCIKDTILVQLLIDKLNLFVNLIAMGNVTYVPFKFLIERGQQIKVFSQILKETKKRNYVIKLLNNGGEGFQGATVLSPITGFYTQPVLGLDFASLYPSIICRWNFCYSTIVLDDKYGNIEGYEYKNIEWKDKNEHGEIIRYNKYRYVQNIRGILPDLLMDLWNERKRIRGVVMKQEKDPFKLMIWDGMQLAIKVSMNSIYGFTSANMLCMTALAASVTAVGREMIIQTKDYVEENFKNSKVIYGDSVTCDTPIILKNKETGKLTVVAIEDIVNQRFTETNKKWNEFPLFKVFDNIGRSGKEYCTIDNYQVWGSNGWTDIKKIIRHKCNKKIYRIKTKKGIVCVTSDHSLLDSNGKMIKPSSCKIGITKLLHGFPKNL